MKEKRADAARGTGYAILLHAILIGLLLFGLHRVAQQGGDAGGDGALQASVASVNDLSAKTRRALLGEPKEASQPLPQPVQAPAELPKPVETPVEAPPQPIPQPVAKDTPPPRPTPERPQPPVKASPAKPEPPPVDAGKKAPTPEPAKKSADADIAAKAAAEAARLAKATTLAKQRAEQLADARSPSGGRDDAASSARTGVGPGKGRNSGQQKWLDAVAQAIEAKWVRPDDIPPGQTCPIHIRIIPGGEVITASVQPDCPYSAEARRSVEKAVRDASPLPFKGYEDVYSRDFTANFKPSR